MTWDQLRHFHREPVVISAWRRLLGPLLRLLTPPRRRLLLSCGALVVAVKYPLQNFARTTAVIGMKPDFLSSVALILTLFALVGLTYFAAKTFTALPMFFRRHPQICLHAVLWFLLAALWFAPLPNELRLVVIGCVIALPFLLWRVGYMMFTAQRGKMRGTRFTDHLFYIFPVWGGSDTPYGKGLDYLSANEARDEEALAKSQLAGVKCFLLAGIWTVAKGLLAGLVFAEENAYRHMLGGLSRGVPRVGAMFAHPIAYPMWLSWVALYAELVWAVLALAVTGHIIVGWLRIFGFHVFRNTYKPLLAESVVEFWNRYYYYFKELLVNFFFYPTFTRYFKTSPQLRLVAAVFMAAFVGNMYYHWLRLDVALVTADFPAMWAALQSRFFYCFLLALGICISMRREQKRAKAPRTFLRRVVAIFGVWTFFSVIHIWAEKDPASFLVRTKFFAGLFGFR